MPTYLYLTNNHLDFDNRMVLSESSKDGFTEKFVISINE